LDDDQQRRRGPWRPLLRDGRAGVGLLHYQADATVAVR
jgi:hypothetical protein